MTFSWIKGHGTENDFVLLPDHDGTVHGDLDPGFVAKLCHRRRGIGADGVLRVMRTSAVPIDSAAEWFMDYRNADGSLSQMCGNGIRVFARHLVEAELVDGRRFAVATRDGDKRLEVGDDGLITVDMGGYRTGELSKITTDEGLAVPAREVHTGNPHAVSFVDDLADAGRLAVEPDYDRGLYPDGVNIEFVTRLGDRAVQLRVHERGSGETRSCGTGACAAVIASALADGDVDWPARYRVDVPGGTLYITLTEDDRVLLAGPAEIVAAGEMEWHG